MIPGGDTTRRARSRSTAKDAGTRFETLIAGCLAVELEDDRIERRTLRGSKDRGDIAGVYTRGGRVVLETKDYGGRFQVGPWLAEAEIERGNDDALACAVVAKRRGLVDPLDQVVLMTVRDLVAFMVGVRPE